MTSRALHDPRKDRIWVFCAQRHNLLIACVLLQKRVVTDRQEVKFRFTGKWVRLPERVFLCMKKRSRDEKRELNLWLTKKVRAIEMSFRCWKWTSSFLQLFMIKLSSNWSEWFLISMHLLGSTNTQVCLLTAKTLGWVFESRCCFLWAIGVD